MRAPAISTRTVLAAGCALALACEGVHEPRNSVPVISDVTPDLEVLLPEGTTSLTCVASDPDADELGYVWEASTGALSGTGPAVSWTSPAEDGTYVITVTVTDGRGGTASDSALVDVIGGTLLVRTGVMAPSGDFITDDLIAMDIEGNELQRWPLFGVLGTMSGPEVWGGRIFVARYDTMYELDYEGNTLMTVPLPDEVPSMLNFVALPGDRFACLTNNEDQIDFVSAAGDLLATVAMPLQSPFSLQNVNGVVVGNRLIVSETGTRHVFSVDVDSYEASLFRWIDDGHGWLGDIDYQDGVYYLTRALRLQSFTEEGDVVHTIATVQEGNLVAVAMVGRYAFGVINHEGKLVRIRLDDGEVVLLRDDLDFPEDIEYLPIALAAQ